MTVSDDDVRIRAEVLANLPLLIEKAVLARSWRYAEPTEEGFVIGHAFYVLFLVDDMPLSVRLVVGERANGHRELDHAEHAPMLNYLGGEAKLAALVEAFES